jgi:ribonuclease P protein component
LKRRYRLSESERFRQIRQEGTNFSHPFFVLCLLPNQLDISRCGFTASRRIGKAVVRNRARRRMREAVRLLWDSVQPGWDLVWIARPALNQAEFSELQAACMRLLVRAGVWQATQIDSGRVRPEAQREL